MKVGLYMRLSRDDGAGESASIENQRTILRAYAKEQGGEIVDEYVDDGFSGTNFNRPAVQRLLGDAKAGKIDTIVVKDLSRFGRNYIEVGQYVDYIFPAYGIRFVALADHVDTLDRSSAAMDMMPIMNVFNEWHAASTSKKIRAVLDASRRAGKYTNWNYPYGYKAGKDGSRTAVIDEKAAAVVRRIYDLRLQGFSAGKIARLLSDEGIPNPATHYVRQDGGKWERPCAPLWAPKTVRWILSNPTYLGHTVQHKTTSVSYKNHKVVHLPESEWIVREQAHEPIVSKDVWDRVQATYQGSRGRADKTGEVHPLSGLLVCSDCGKKLKCKRGKSGSVFVCRTYTELGKSYCTSHSISEKALHRLVLEDFRAIVKGTEVDEAAVRAHFLQERAKQLAQSRASDEKQRKALCNRLAELEKLIEAAFEEKVLGKMPESVCTRLCETYQKEREAVLESLCALKDRLAEQEDDTEGYLQSVKPHACDTLTRELCLFLIDRITVGEKTEAAREVHIYYKFRKENNL